MAIDFNTKINNRIRELQAQRNWSTNHLAVESGVSLATIINWFNRRATPSVNLLEKICSAFGITIAEFFNDDDEKIQLTAQEKELLGEWALLSPAERDAILSTIKVVNQKVKDSNPL